MLESDMVDQILVRFEGEGSGVAELTWGQLGMWQSFVAAGHSKTVGGVSPLPDGVRAEYIAETLRYAMSRHQALRTKFPMGPNGIPRQECHSAGEIALEIVDAGAADPAEVAAEVHARYQDKSFDYANEWPVRMAVITQGDRVPYMVAVYLHLVLDATGMTLLIADIAARDPATGQGPPVTGMPPLEQARRQATPAGQRQNAMALAYLEHVLRTVPISRFGPPRYAGEASFQMLRYRSPATLLAAQAIAARNATNTSPVLVAAYTVAQSRLTGTNPVLLMITVSNRFRPGLANSISTLSYINLFMIDVAGISFATAVNRAAQGTISAYKHAYCDPYAQDVVLDRVHADRGAEVELSVYYNDRRQDARAVGGNPPTAAQIQAAVPASTLEWVQDPEMPKSALYLYVDDAPGAIEFELSGDARYFSAADLVELVRQMESVLVEAALDPAAPTGVPAAAPCAEPAESVAGQVSAPS
ncbi:MAG TPA: condensation domain-containing protein [Mycobacteriales bacterium]|nr:condensation domain-containing protein [Mycobacteriales bacterium]